MEQRTGMTCPSSIWSFHQVVISSKLNPVDHETNPVAFVDNKVILIETPAPAALLLMVRTRLRHAPRWHKDVIEAVKYRESYTIATARTNLCKGDLTGQRAPYQQFCLDASTETATSTFPGTHLEGELFPNTVYWFVKSQNRETDAERWQNAAAEALLARLQDSVLEGVHKKRCVDSDQLFNEHTPKHGLQ
jgi:hypothetical protein